MRAPLVKLSQLQNSLGNLPNTPRRANMKYSDTVLNLEQWPLTELGQTYALHIDSSYFCAELFVNPNWGSKDKEQTQNTVIQCLTLNYDLDPILVKHMHCTSTHFTWHLYRVICNFQQGFKRYRANTKYSDTMFNLKRWPWYWTQLSQTYALHIVSWYLTLVPSHFKMSPTLHELELSLNAIHTPTNVLDKVGTRVRWVLQITQLGWTFELSLKKIFPLV